MRTASFFLYFLVYCIYGNNLFSDWVTLNSIRNGLYGIGIGWLIIIRLFYYFTNIF